MSPSTPKGLLVGYARTSTAEQAAGLEAQVRDLIAAGCTKIFQEQVSSIAERAELERALDYVRAGDTLVVTKVDRLARSTVGLWEIVKRLEALEDGGAGLRVLNLGGETVDTKSATGKLILTIFAGFAQFEREMMLERQREGIAKAKAENRYLGRKPSARLKADEAVKLFKAGRTVTDVARALSIGRGSVYRALAAAGLPKADAQDRAEELAATLSAMKAEGVTSANGLAKALNFRGFVTPRQRQVDVP
jgi:DNA invertase Pin-like site-specific DNA recombinase